MTIHDVDDELCDDKLEYVMFASSASDNGILYHFVLSEKKSDLVSVE